MFGRQRGQRRVRLRRGSPPRVPAWRRPRPPTPQRRRRPATTSTTSLFIRAPPSSMTVSSSSDSASCSVRRRKRCVRSSFGRSSTSVGMPSSTIRPSSMNTTRSPTSRANCISCVTTSIVIPDRARSRMTTSTSPTSSGSSADVTSSKSITCGSIISARAIATRCCCPPESWCGYCLGLLLEPDGVEQLDARAARPRRATGCLIRRAASVRLSITFRCGKRLNCWKTIPIRCRTPERRRPSPVISSPSKKIRPGPNRLEQVDAAQQRALAAAARPDHDEHLAALRRSGRSRRGRGCRRSSCGRPRGGRLGRRPLGDGDGSGIHVGMSPQWPTASRLQETVTPKSS